MKQNWTKTKPPGGKQHMLKSFHDKGSLDARCSLPSPLNWLDSTCWWQSVNKKIEHERTLEQLVTPMVWTEPIIENWVIGSYVTTLKVIMRPDFIGAIDFSSQFKSILNKIAATKLSLSTQIAFRWWITLKFNVASGTKKYKQTPSFARKVILLIDGEMTK